MTTTNHPHANGITTYSSAAASTSNHSTPTPTNSTSSAPTHPHSNHYTPTTSTDPDSAPTPSTSNRGTPTTGTCPDNEPTRPHSTTVFQPTSTPTPRPSAGPAPTPNSPSTSTAEGPGSAATRALLRCGVAAGPVFVVVGMAHAVVRPGFDMARHPMSMLALGGTGWIQTATFLISGLLVLLWAVGLQRRARGLAVAAGVLGVGLIAAGVFPADPAFGFPEGAPAGPPESMSTAGALHAVAFGVAMVGWVAVAVLLARHFAKVGRRSWAVASGVAVVVLLAPIAVMGVTPVLYVSSVLSWAWTTAVAVRLATSTPAGT